MRSMHGVASRILHQIAPRIWNRACAVHFVLVLNKVTSPPLRGHIVNKRVRSQHLPVQTRKNMQNRNMEEVNHFVAFNNDESSEFRWDNDTYIKNAYRSLWIS